MNNNIDAPGRPIAPASYTDDDIIALARPLFDTMSQRVKPEEMALMQQAFDLAREAHASQRRKSGEPYIIHPIAVARIVGEELGLGTNPVCAAFLHDVVEDTDYTIEDIESRFGTDIAFLVKVVTKSKKSFYESSKQVDNFRQMLDSVNYDVRALLVKLADRLHNMRTLSSMRPDKQMKIAGETDYFYAPLANRLGLYNVKTELENLSFRYRCPREYAHLEQMIDQERRRILPYLEDFRKRVGDKLARMGITADISIATRRPYSIRRKMADNNSDFEHLEQMHAINIIYDVPQGKSEKDTALTIYAGLTDIFEEKPHSLSNYIDHPKENGYQSLHVHLLADNGHWQEVHISSRRMHRVQLLGYVADWSDSNISGWLDKLRATLRDMADHSHEVSFMEGVTSSFYSDDITVYTPSGQAVILPRGASAIDFAFEIHSDLGLHAKWARINGRIQSLKTPLKRGDLVEIGTADDAHPDADWLDNTLTYKAKRHVNAWLIKQPMPTMMRCEHCHPLPGDEVIGFNIAGGMVEVHKRDCPLAISMASQSGDSVTAVDFEPDDTLYGVTVQIRAVDRFHLFIEMMRVISDELQLNIKTFNTTSVDNIIDCDISFNVHSAEELAAAISALNAIEGVDEVCHKTQ